MTYSNIKFTRDGDVGIIAFSDPATLNAITPAMADETTDALNTAARDCRCVILTGEGRAFCSGANLTGEAMPIANDGLVDAGLLLETHFNPFVTLLRNYPIPLLTAVNGVAAGIGCSLALFGDLIVAGESAYFLQAFRRIGLVPDGASSYLLPRMLTRAQAMEMMLLGEKLPAAKALEWGLINRCVPDAEVMPTTLKLAHELARGPTKALAMIRRMTWDSLDATFAEAIQTERVMQRHAARTEDFVEGVSAFAQKRPAQFKGN